MASTIFPFSSFLSSVFLLSQGQSMEINISCLLAVVNTIAFDLCYLLAICIHKRLLFIIIVCYPHLLSLFFRNIFARFPFFMKQSFELWCLILTLREAFKQGCCQAQKLTCLLLLSVLEKLIACLINFF